MANSLFILQTRHTSTLQKVASFSRFLIEKKKKN